MKKHLEFWKMQAAFPLCTEDGKPEQNNQKQNRKKHQLLFPKDKLQS